MVTTACCGNDAIDAHFDVYSDGQGMVAIIAVWLIIHSAVENGSAYGRSIYDENKIAI